MSEEMKTIRELADELGVSKDKIKYRVRKLPSELSTKVNGITYLKKEAIYRVSQDMGVKLPPNCGEKTPTLPTGSTHPKKEASITIPTSYLLEELKKKEVELENKNKQIDNLIESQKQTQNLLDQQQQLSLQDKQLIKELRQQLALNSPVEKKETDSQEEMRSQIEQLKEEKQKLQEEKDRLAKIAEDKVDKLTTKKWYQFWKK